jgi:tripartite-type tricarboxylate transporter receptor subunit TctC
MTASAQDTKPIEWVVGYAAGGTDIVARTVGGDGADLKQPIIVNNKPGAATNIAATTSPRARIRRTRY